MDPGLVSRLAHEYGITSEKIERLRRIPYTEAVAELSELKRNARQVYRKLAFAYHPDRNPGDLLAETLFRALPEVLKLIENLKVAPPAAPPPVVVHFAHMSPQVVQVRTAPSYSTSTTAATNSGANYNAARVVFMRWC